MKFNNKIKVLGALTIIVPFIGVQLTTMTGNYKHGAWGFIFSFGCLFYLISKLDQGPRHP